MDRRSEGMTRRRLLAAAVPAVALIPAAAQNPFSGGGSIASAVGQFAAKNAAGGIIGSVAGNLVTPLIFGPSEEITKLNEILDKLNALQESIDSFRSDVEKRFNRQEYLSVASKAYEINKTNRFLMGPYKKWIGGDRDAKDEFFDRLAEKSKELNEGLQDWHDAIVGSDGAGDALGMPGMIRSFQRAVLVRRNGLLGPEAAREIQDHWDRLDASQAITVLFSVFDKAMKGQARGIRYKLEEWRELREQQLKLLRGVARKSDTFYHVDAPDRPVLTPLNYLPDRTVITTANSVMWYTEAGGPVFREDNANNFNVKFRRVVPPAVDTPGGQRGGWGLRSADDLKELIRACGGPGDGSHYNAVLKKAGFILHEERKNGEKVALWTSNFVDRDQETVSQPSRGVPGGNRRRVHIYGRTIVMEDDGAIPARKADWDAMCIFGRGMDATEAARYWYPD